MPAAYSEVEEECVHRLARECAGQGEAPKEPSRCSQLVFAWPTQTILRGACRDKAAGAQEGFPQMTRAKISRLTFPEAKKHWDAQVREYKQKCASGEVAQHPDKDFKPRLAKTSRR